MWVIFNRPVAVREVRVNFTGHPNPPLYQVKHTSERGTVVLIPGDLPMCELHVFTT